MKKLIASLLAVCLLAHSPYLHAGNVVETNAVGFHKSASDDGIKGKIMINAGVGFNILGTSLVLKYNLSSYWDNHNFDNITGHSSAMYNIGVDYGVAKKFSVGVAFGYQTAKVNVTDVYNSNYNSYYAYDYTDSWKRIHIAVKGDYHIIAKDHISLYTGLKIGYNIYSMTSTYSKVEPDYTSQLNVSPSPISVQAHFGINYYFNSIVGFNAEVGIGYGGPYIFAAGVAVKI